MDSFKFQSDINEASQAEQQKMKTNFYTRLLEQKHNPDLAKIISTYGCTENDEKRRIIEAPKEKKSYPIFRATPTPITSSTSAASNEKVRETAIEVTSHDFDVDES